MKNGWKTRSSVGFAIPKPASFEIAKPLAYQLVIVSGTLTSNVFVPSSDLDIWKKFSNNSFSADIVGKKYNFWNERTKQIK